jgi:uncharacterized protein
MTTDLPHIIPLFPLPNLVLFPGVKVPLHIFEPRYREMVGDVTQDDGIVGMMTLKGDWEREYYAYPDIFEVGCAGRIISLSRLADGRFNLILEGRSEFKVAREIRDRSYRRAEVDWCPVEPRFLEIDPPEMARLHELLSLYLGTTATQVWDAVVKQSGLKGAELLNYLCFHLDLSPIEKQTLLEALDERLSVFFDVLTFRLEERKLGPRGPAGGQGLVQ